MMMDADVVATSPATVYRVLKSAGLMSRWNQKTNIKKMVSSYRLNHTSHRHVDLAYVIICSSFFTCAAPLMAAADLLFNSEARDSMKESGVEIVYKEHVKSIQTPSPESLPTTAAGLSPKTSRNLLGLLE